MLETAKKLGEEFCEFVNQSYSPFHVVDLCRKALSSSGFIPLSENSNWELKKGQKYLFSRNNSTLVAFSIGDKFDPNDTGFKILGAHTDSPQLKLAPISKLNCKGFNQSCVECYGGGLWHTWFDRDLKLGGKIIYKDENKVIKEKLLTIPKSVAKIINIAPHLQTMEERKKFDFNKETHLRPIFSTDEFEKLLTSDASSKPAEKKESTSAPQSLSEKHYSSLLKLICKESGLAMDNILDWDLRFSDSQPSQLLGINEEFVSSGKIDNLYSTFSALKTLTSSDYQIKENKFIDLVFLFDHEEIGSESAQGAASPIVLETLSRIFKLLTQGIDMKKDAYEKALRKSYILSADCAHSVHPCYSDKHQSNHQCKLNQGIVLKINANQRYASDAVSQSLLRIIADKHNVPLQDFIVKNDSPCGSTIGPISAGKTGIKTVDIGAPQLGMHSIRETAGVVDMYYYVKLFEAFFNEYEKIQHNLLDQ